MSADTARLSTTPKPFGKPGGPGLWHTKGEKLPNYIEQVAHAIQKTGKSESQAIEIAIGRIRDWAEGKGNVSPEVRAAAQKAIAEWEALKAKHHAHSSDTPGVELSAKADQSAADFAAGKNYRYSHGWKLIDSAPASTHADRLATKPTLTAQAAYVRGMTHHDLKATSAELHRRKGGKASHRLVKAELHRRKTQTKGAEKREKGLMNGKGKSGFHVEENHDRALSAEGGRVIELSAATLLAAGVRPEAVELAAGQKFRYRHGWIKVGDDGGGSDGAAPVHPMGKRDALDAPGFTTSNSRRAVPGSGFTTSNSSASQFSRDVLSYGENNAAKLAAGTQLTAGQRRRRTIVSRLAGGAAIAASFSGYGAEAGGEHIEPAPITAVVQHLDDHAGLRAMQGPGLHHNAESKMEIGGEGHGAEGGGHGEEGGGGKEEKEHGYGFPRDVGPSAKELSETLKRNLSRQLAEQIGGSAIATAPPLGSRSGAVLSSTAAAVELSAGEGSAYRVEGRVITLLKDWTAMTDDEKCGWAVAMTLLAFPNAGADDGDGPDAEDDTDTDLSRVHARAIELGVPLGHPRAVELATPKKAEPQRYRHGWIPIGGKLSAPGKGGEGDHLPHTGKYKSLSEASLHAHHGTKASNKQHYVTMGKDRSFHVATVKPQGPHWVPGEDGGANYSPTAPKAKRRRPGGPPPLRPTAGAYLPR